MTQREHDDPAIARPHQVQRREADAGHPLLELQQQAGNAAVTRMLAVQRHTLDPEEESGD